MSSGPTSPKSSWDELLEGKLAPGDVLASKYELEEVVGSGAMGFVLRARHQQLDEPVAVKFLLPELAANEEALARFEREARAAFKIKSEHVARVFDVGRLESGEPFIVMEYLEGVDLSQMLDSRGALPVVEAVDLLLEACEAIAEAHNLGIVHRDLKPENLFVARRRDGSTRLKVLDFGLSKLLSTAVDGQRPRALTSTEQVMGTAHYMSPEQWMATKDVGPATDIWALGVIAYELITDFSPFYREKLPQMCNAVLRDEPPPLAERCPEAPDGLEAALLKCIAKNAAERYHDVGELAAALAPYASEDGALLAQRIAKSVSEGPTSSQRLLLAAPPSSPEAETEPLPRLGLRRPDGGVDSWKALMHEAPPPTPQSRTALAVGAALLVLALVLLGVAFAT